MKENRKAYFYPRPPRGGRLTREYYYSGREQFLSTPSARRATGAYPRRGAQTSDFYPRPPRGGRPLSFAISPYSADFYPRPPRGGRPATAWASRRTQRFLSTPSARRATLTVLPVSTGEKRFLSTPSARRATVLRQPTKEPSPISIHALREEGDVSPCAAWASHARFLSTPSARRATVSGFACSRSSEFLSTPSARRATFGKRYAGADRY